MGGAVRRFSGTSSGGRTAASTNVSAYTMSAPSVRSASSRARWTALLTTPVRWRSRSRPSKPTRSTDFVEDGGEVAGQDAPVEGCDGPRLGPPGTPGPMRRERLAEPAANLVHVIGSGEPASAGLGHHIRS